MYRNHALFTGALTTHIRLVQEFKDRRPAMMLVSSFLSDVARLAITGCCHSLRLHEPRGSSPQRYRCWLAPLVAGDQGEHLCSFDTTNKPLAGAGFACPLRPWYPMPMQRVRRQAPRKYCQNCGKYNCCWAPCGPAPERCRALCSTLPALPQACASE